MNKRLYRCLIIAFLFLLAASLYLAVRPHTTSQSYIMSVSGPNYQVLNGATNAVLYQSTSSSAAFNYIVGPSGVARRGDSVYVESGAYLVDNTWLIAVSDVTVDYNAGAILTTINNFGKEALLIAGNNIVVSDITIDGNGNNQFPPATTKLTMGTGYFDNGIVFKGSNCLVQRATIHNIRVFGVVDQWKSGTINDGVIDSKIYDCGANGLTVGDTGSNFYFINNEIYRCSDVGITSYGVDTIIKGNHVHDMNESAPIYGWVNSYWGIGFEGGGGSGNGKYVEASENTVNRCLAGIVVFSSGQGNINNVRISRNIISDIGWSPYANGGIMLFDTSYDIIEYNSVSNAYYGVYQGTAAGSYVGNTFNGNTFSGCTVNIGELMLGVDK